MTPVRPCQTVLARHKARRPHRWSGGAALAVLALALASCGGGSSSSSSAPTTTAHAGGVYTILANSAFGVADPAQNYTLEEGQLLIDTHDGLVGFAKVGRGPRTQRTPDPCPSRPAATHARQT